MATAFLMVKFYENLRGEASVAVALNQAQCWLRDISKGELQSWIEEKRRRGWFGCDVEESVTSSVV
ncbi:MAG: CHAT domain-containing protein [Xenococcaceae cyanobacterium]